MVAPVSGAESAGVIQLLALLVPFIALAIAVSAVPAVRATLSSRTETVRSFFYGPVDLQQQTPDQQTADDDGLAIVDTPVPDWFDPSIFDEPDDDEDLDAQAGTSPPGDRAADGTNRSEAETNPDT